MLINVEEFGNAARNIADLLSGNIGVDLETTGLSPWRGDKAVIMGFTDTEGNKFCVYLTPELKPLIELFFSNPRLNYCAHHTSFEKSFMQVQYGIDIPNWWDSETMARVAYDKPFSKMLSFSLQACAQRIGHSKTPEMLAWLKLKGNKGRHVYAPAALLEEYVSQDAWLSWRLALGQAEVFRHWDTSSPVPIRNVVTLEYKTASHLSAMESFGLLVDVNYCKRALEYEQHQIERAKREFQKLTGVPFVDSRKTLQPVFDSHGIRYGATAIGNASFTEDALRGSKGNPIVAEVLRFRGATKRASSYWLNFLELEHNGIIHPSINGNKAATGRMSIQDPSCQNWSTDEDDPEFPIRRAFIAREESFIGSLDYSQMELRLICDEAGDMGMIKAIQEGADFHQQVADQANVPRSLAKNGRFAKLYGAGVKKVAETLGVAMPIAASICEAIDQSSPQVAEYSRTLTRYAEKAPFGYNFLGRRFYFDKGFAYKYPNYKIQGGCGEILRFAICSVGDFLREEATSPLTRMLIPIHDELVINFHEKDRGLIAPIRELMIKAHKSKRHLEMDVSVHTGPNFFDLEALK